MCSWMPVGYPLAQNVSFKSSKAGARLSSSVLLARETGLVDSALVVSTCWNESRDFVTTTKNRAWGFAGRLSC